ncbi:MAG TPA: HlyD family type I secretion periplasmic adaptor subunit, partial [Rhodospirillales bacterium]|nr:HlyD family type I secretion periplasmic adaptor subunit [Rhodospirillales bacterium]
RIEQLRKQIAGTQSQAGADIKRLSLYEEEAASVSFLLERGFERRPRLLELQRVIAELKGRRGEQDNTISRSLEEIAGAELQIVSLRDDRLAEVARDLADAQSKEADLIDRIRAAEDVLQRQEIVSPQDGIVVDPRLVTPGGVIGPGQPLLDIVPVDDPLLVETRIDPVDIDVVHEGLPAQVRLTGFKRSNYPPIDGRVAYVSADQLSDPKTQQPYFLARVTLDPKALSAWTGGALSPGMPGEVIIITGKRRAVDYLLSPLTDRMRHAFREE